MLGKSTNCTRLFFNHLPVNCCLSLWRFLHGPCLFHHTRSSCYTFWPLATVPLFITATSGFSFLHITNNCRQTFVWLLSTKVIYCLFVYLLRCIKVAQDHRCSLFNSYNQIIQGSDIFHINNHHLLYLLILTSLSLLIISYHYLPDYLSLSAIALHYSPQPSTTLPLSLSCQASSLWWLRPSTSLIGSCKWDPECDW